MPESNATALVFSGRPNPTWTISADDTATLLGVWEGLESAETGPPEPSGLGYRGVVVTAPDGRCWYVFAGLADLSWQSSNEARVDADRALEQMILGTAPLCLLPPIET